jgi:purine-nucleoside phosphorylase
MNNHQMQNIKEAVETIRLLTSFKPEIGIILGTGLGSLVDFVQIEKAIEYDQIPHFPISTVESHHGKLLFGTLGGKKVVVMQGRFHYYEGYSMQQVTFPVRVMKFLGIKNLIVSNAAGGLNPAFAVSDLMILNDHINLLPANPLTGPNLDELGPRFPDMSEPYDRSIIKLGLEISKTLERKVHQGVYAVVTGPTLETPAEYNYLRTIGADAVGMSTVPEVIVARHMGIPVFAVSVITDLCYPGAIEKVTVEKVIEAARRAEPQLTQLIAEILSSL